MSQDVSFRRKIIYVAAIALLLFPLFLLGQPATTRSRAVSWPNCGPSTIWGSPIWARSIRPARP
jgi:hypothetical protein